MTTVTATSSPAPTQPLDADYEPEISSLGALGTPEAALAMASLHVEQSADRSRVTRNESRKARSAAKRSAIEHDREAASLAMWSTIVGAGLNMAGSLLNTAGVSASDENGKGGGDYKNAGALAQGVGQIGGAVLTAFADGEKSAAATDRVLAEEASDRSEQSDSHAQALQRHAGKMMDGASKISEEAHRATMAALRA